MIIISMPSAKQGLTVFLLFECQLRTLHRNRTGLITEWLSLRINQSLHETCSEEHISIQNLYFNILSKHVVNDLRASLRSLEGI